LTPSFSGISTRRKAAAPGPGERDPGGGAPIQTSAPGAATLERRLVSSAQRRSLHPRSTASKPSPSPIDSATPPLQSATRCAPAAPGCTKAPSQAPSGPRASRGMTSAANHGTRTGIATAAPLESKLRPAAPLSVGGLPGASAMTSAPSDRGSATNRVLDATGARSVGARIWHCAGKAKVGRPLTG
jgi:hypothetical protein